MIKAKEYYPIGSVVLLKGALKKAMIIGIMQTITTENGDVTEYDYMAVLYPEGFINKDTMFMFNHDAVLDVVFRGYENSERKALVDKLQENMDKYL